MAQLIFNQQSAPTVLLGLVKIEAAGIGNGCPIHTTIKNLFDILHKHFFTGVTQFFYEVYSKVEGLSLSMMLGATVNPGIMLV